ncbi:MAG: NHL repeat-containing protein [Solirubrobacterales bacterium]
MGIRGFQKGVLLAAVLMAGYLPAADAHATIDLRGEWATTQPDRGNYGSGLAVGPDGSAYVLTKGRNQIVKYAADGTIADRWQIRAQGPTALTVDSRGIVLVAVNRKLERYTGDGQRLRPWRYDFPKKAVRLADVSAITVGPDGTVYLLDWLDSTIVRLSPDGSYLGQFGRWGFDSGQFLLPEDLAAGPDGRIYVIESVSSRVQVFGPHGRFIEEWGAEGLGPGQFWETSSIAIDDQGLMYITDQYLNRVQVFNADGQFLDQIGSRGGGPGRFRDIETLATDPDGTFLVGDKSGRRLQRFIYTDGPHRRQAQIYFSARDWPIQSTPGRKRWLPMDILNFGDIAARDLVVCPIRTNRFSKQALRGVKCLQIGSVKAMKRRKFGFRVKVPANVPHGKFRSLRFSLRSENAGGGSIPVAIYAGHDFSWDMD